MDLVITISAYRSHSDRENNYNVVESVEVRTVKDFDAVEKSFYDRGFYVGYFSKSGARLKGGGARYILENHVVS